MSPWYPILRQRAVYNGTNSFMVQYLSSPSGSGWAELLRNKIGGCFCWSSKLYRILKLLCYFTCNLMWQVFVTNFCDEFLWQSFFEFWLFLWRIFATNFCDEFLRWIFVMNFVTNLISLNFFLTSTSQYQDYSYVHHMIRWKLKKTLHASLCEVTINSICKSLFFHPHLCIKSKTSAYISRRFAYKI